MKRSFHDLSVLFDDDGSAYVVWGYQDIHLAQLDSTLTDIVPGTERVLFPKDAGMGEGSHFYKIDGTYYITSAWYAGRMRLACARADHLDGPWEVNPAISVDEAFGMREGPRLRGNGTGPEITVDPGEPHVAGSHVDAPGRDRPDTRRGVVGLLDVRGQLGGAAHRAVAGDMARRLALLRPSGEPRPLAADLGQAAHRSPLAADAPYRRNDDFDGPELANVWQWNHVPVDSMWSLAERPGFLRLHALAAPDFWWARNTLTQRAIGPQSSSTTILEAGGMQPGDAAGLALLDRPYAWIGVRRADDGMWLEQVDQLTGDTARVPLTAGRVWLRADCDFLTEQARFSYSTDGTRFTTLGPPFGTVFQLKTFQGVRYALFSYNVHGVGGGWADFDAMQVSEPHPHGLTRPIPVGQTISLGVDGRDMPFAVGGEERFEVVDRGLGRVALRAGGRFLSATPATDGTSTVACGPESRATARPSSGSRPSMATWR